MIAFTRSCVAVFILIALSLLLFACAGTRFERFDPGNQNQGIVYLENFRFIEQQSMTCGSTCLLMVLNFWGDNITRSEINKAIPPQEDGITAGKLRVFAKARGFESFLFSGDHSLAAEHLSKGRPIIVLLPSTVKGNHYCVLVGFGHNPPAYILVDPHEGWRKADIAEFEELHRKTQRLMLLVGKT